MDLPRNACRAVAAFLPTEGWGYLRQSGSAGSSLFEELVDEGRVPLWAAVNSICGSLRAPVQSLAVATPNLTVCVAALCGRDVSGDMCDVVEEGGIHLVGEVWIPQCEDLVVTGMERVVGADNFMVFSPVLRSCRLEGTTSLFETPDSMLSQNRRLAHVSLAALADVQVIGRWLLSGCVSLPTVDLSMFSNVTEISGGFLSGCEGITHLDLSAFVNVTHIGGTFLEGCRSLGAIGLAPFGNVSSIGSSFLGSCCSLPNVDLSPLESLVAIGMSFLVACAGLQQINLEPLRNVSGIPTGFLRGCTSLDLDERCLAPIAHLPGFTEDILKGTY